MADGRQAGQAEDNGGCVVVFLASAHTLARRAVTSPDAARIEDDAITAVQVLRAVIGTVATFFMLWTYGVDGGWSAALKDGISKLFLAPVVLLAVGPLVLVGFIWYAPKENRPLLRSRLGYPLKAVVLYVMGAVATYGCFIALRDVQDIYHSIAGYGYKGLLLGIVLRIVLFVVLLWLVTFVFFASGAVARHAFNTGLVHPMLPAIFTAICVWGLNLISMGDGLPNGPLPIKIAALLGGPLSVTAVSAWELYFLRTRYGVRVRGHHTGHPAG
ncbi:hypothetical protein FGW37_07795 [Streptomyces rectiverticillatus]|uniref:hypothetical protein n=1 Tax=Streptomyces rectiverticillatus TaxID=173860 RepID=UPI0015C3CB45|nr:hypothetical protein [Streptomyces rectiverticillatus]QLE71510.1 hypothetical protein FGW37_07795 [Streptomyces rectiverticillatus]